MIKSNLKKNSNKTDFKKQQELKYYDRNDITRKSVRFSDINLTNMVRSKFWRH